MNKHRVFWVLFAVVLALTGTSAALQIQRAGKGDGGRTALELTTLGKMALAGTSLPGAAADAYEAPLLTKLDALEADASGPDRARALRRKAIWCSFRERDCAEGAIDALGRIPADERAPAPADEADVLREALTSKAISKERAGALEARVGEIRLGWFGRLLRERLHRHAGDDAAADADLASAMRNAWLALVAMLAFMALLGAGVVAWLVLLLSPARRRVLARLAEGLRARGDEQEQGGAARRMAVAAIFLAAAIAIPFATSALGLRTGEDPTGRAGWTAALEGGLLLLVLCAHFVFQRPAGLKLGFEGSSPVRAVGVGVFSYLLLWPVLLAVMLPLGALFDRLGIPSQSHPIAEQLQVASDTPGALVLWVVIAAVLAPVLEEAVFRGSLQGALTARLGGRAAVPVVAVLFAIIHPQVGLGLVGVLVIGLWLSLVRVHERSLWPGVVMHAINNGVALLLAMALLSG